ncbi:uncharacterized protein [Antedon mediterranea]|uniref:uncharacterized protein isoform X2 n=1 Tax=Antedon mediterranea TaxID=105859 RepID=UPI003AF47355
MAESVTHKDDRNEEDARRKIHPPSKKACDQQIEALVLRIQRLEQKLKFMKAHSAENVSPSSSQERKTHILNTLKEDKENKMKKRKEIDERLKVMSSAINRKSDELSKKQARQPARSIDKLESMIKRLEYQLEKNHFTVREETRIVHEIDRLKRSKKTLREYIGEKEELDVEIAKKNRLRAEREKLFKEISRVSEEEHKVKKQLKEVRSQATVECTSLKKEIDELYSQKRKIQANYQVELKQFHEQRAMLREQNERQKTLQREAKHRELKQKIKEQVSEPFSYKLKVCNILNIYLVRCRSDSTDSGQNHTLTDRNSLFVPPIQDAAASSSHFPTNTSLSTSSSFNEDVVRVIIRKKNEEDEWMFAGNVTRMRKKQAKMRNRKPSWRIKSISHPPDIFPLFSEVGLTAPSSVGDVADVLAQLQKVKDQYEQCSRKKTSDAGNTGIDSGTASSSECYSPSTAEMVPDYKKYGSIQKSELNDGTDPTNNEEDDIDSVFDDNTDNIVCAVDEDDDTYQKGVSIIPSFKINDERPQLKLKISTNHFESEVSLPKQFQDQCTLEATDALTSQDVTPTEDRFASEFEAEKLLPEDNVLKVGTEF